MAITSFITDPDISIYTTSEDIFKHYSQEAKTLGFAIVKGKKCSKQILDMVCECYGKPRYNEKKSYDIHKNKRGTYKCNCTFRIVYRFSLSGWNRTISCFVHVGHSLVPDLVHQSRINRHVSRELSLEIFEKKTNGTSNLGIQSELYDKKGFLFTPKQISNAASSIRMEGGRNDIDAFIKNLNESTDFIHRILENNGEFKALWLTFSSNINFIKCYSQMVMLDATYKTTLYGFPLINVIAFDPFGCFFIVLSALVISEGSDILEWIFSSFKSGFPSFNPVVFITDRDSTVIPFIKSKFMNSSILFCQWHIEKNIYSKFKKLFGSSYDEFLKLFKGIMHAQGSSELSALKVNIITKFPSAKDYLEMLFKIECHWVDFYALTLPTFGYSVTSPCESIHSYIKRNISCIGGLVKFFEGMQNAVLRTDRHNELKIFRMAMSYSTHVDLPQFWFL